MAHMASEVPHVTMLRSGLCICRDQIFYYEGDAVKLLTACSINHNIHQCQCQVAQIDSATTQVCYHKVTQLLIHV